MIHCVYTCTCMQSVCLSVCNKNKFSVLHQNSEIARNFCQKFGGGLSIIFAVLKPEENVQKRARIYLFITRTSTSCASV